jgi:hypothetical protein
VAGTHQKPNSAKFNLFENRQNSIPDSYSQRPNITMLYKLVQILRKTQKENKDSKEEEHTTTRTQISEKSCATWVGRRTRN